jgi:hypothetical protein
MTPFSKLVLTASTLALFGFSSLALAQSRFQSNPGQGGKKNLVFESTQAPSRMIYLNGTNIGNVRNQELQSVTVRIDEAGNINIIAPQYDVSQESSYHPLLPAELPKFPKAHAQIPGIPEGRYSKDTASPSTLAPRNEMREEEPARSMPASISAEKSIEREPSAPLTTKAGATTPAIQSSPNNIPPPATPDIPSELQGKNM